MMSDEEMNKLASMIVQKIFEEEDRLQEEFLRQYEQEMLAEEAKKPVAQRIAELQKVLKDALDLENYEAAAKIQKQINELKNK